MELSVFKNYIKQMDDYIEEFEINKNYISDIVNYLKGINDKISTLGGNITDLNSDGKSKDFEKSKKEFINFLENDQKIFIGIQDLLKKYEKGDNILLANMYYRKGISIYYLYKFKKSFKLIDYTHVFQWKNQSPRLKTLFFQYKNLRIYYHLMYQNLLNLLSKHMRFVYDYYDALGCEKAIKCLDEAIKFNREHFDAWNYKALILYDLERYEESKKCLEELVINFPANTLGRIYLGKVLLNLGDLDGATKNLKIAEENVETNDIKGMRRCLKGLINLKNEKYEDSSEFFEEAISLDPFERKYVIWRNYAKYLNIEARLENFEKRSKKRETNNPG